MGLLSNLLLWPVKSPVAGSLWIAAKITEAAEAQRNDKGALMDALREAEAQLLAGTLSEDAYDLIEDDLLRRLAEAK